MPPVRHVAVDRQDHVSRRCGAKIDIEPVDVVRSAPAVEAVPANPDPLVRPVLGDVVRPAGRDYRGALGIDRERRRDGAHVRHGCPDLDCSGRPDEADREGVAARGDAGRHSRTTRANVRRADDVAQLGGPRGVHPRREHAVDRARERGCPNRLAVAEPEALSHRERVRPPVARDLREACRGFRHEAERRGDGLVRVGHQPQARGVEERPGRRRVGERGVEVVDSRANRVADSEDAALARLGTRERRPCGHGEGRCADEAPRCPAIHSTTSRWTLERAYDPRRVSTTVSRCDPHQSSSDRRRA